jgi:hypothetical protein
VSAQVDVIKTVKAVVTVQVKHGDWLLAELSREIRPEAVALETDLAVHDALVLAREEIRARRGLGGEQGDECDPSVAEPDQSPLYGH